MSLPAIQNLPNGYRFAWEEERVQIKVSRLKSHTDGRVNGEIIVTTNAEGYSPHLHLAQFNFTSSTARKALSRQLKELYEVDWEQILEQLSVYTLERHRSGEPAESICTDVSEIKPPQYILEPFLIKNYPTVFFGDPSAFKSSMALILIAAISLPWYDNPLRLSAPAKPVKVLVLDWETDRETIEYQLACLQTGMKIGPVGMIYRRCFAPLFDDLEQIHNMVIDHEIDLVVIDSLGLASGGDLKEASTAIQFFAALRRLNVTSLILAHTAKNNENSKRSIFGSVYFEAQARNVWELKKRQDKGSSALDLLMKNTKSPPFRKPYQDIGFHVTFEEDATMIERSDPKNIAEFLETMGTQERVMEHIKEHGPSTPKEIASSLGISQGNARVVLLNLKNKGWLVNNDGYYGRVYQGVIDD